MLSAVLGGVEAGMALAGALALFQLLEWERAHGMRLLVELGARERRFIAPG